MLSGTWAELAAQSLLHALVAALAVEALLRLWRARAPSDRLQLRLLGLAQPLLVTPALAAAAPAADGEGVRGALFASRHWADLELAGVSALHVLVALGAAAGAALFLMDLLPLVAGRRRALPPPAPPPEALAAALREAAERRGVAPPALHFVESRAAALYCAGVRAPSLVVSRGALELLDRQELRAALGHELAHLEARDPAASWALMAIRGLLFFNPVAQVVARALARDAEWRADARAGGDRLALASAVLKLHRAGLARAAARRTLPLAEPFRRARSHDVVARCRRLLEPALPPEVPFRLPRLALTGGCLAALAFLVT